MLKKILLLIPLLVFAGCTSVADFFSEEEKSTILLLYTNDEHGHIYEKDGWYKGVALYEMWEEEEKNCKNCHVIKISGGDNYTGTAVSTFFKGASMAEVMGLLGYKAAALGNHEFDFGKSELTANSRTAKMPYICSNFVPKDKNSVTEPYFVHYAGSVKMLFVATITEETLQISRAPAFVESDIVDPLLPVSQAIASEKADIDVIIAHESYKDAKNWIGKLPKKPLVVFTGHDHKEAVTETGGVFFVQNAGYLPGYAKVLIEKNGKKFQVVKAETVPLKREISLESEGSLEVKKTLDKYLTQLGKKAGEKLVYAGKPLDTASLQRLFACSMLESFSDYDAAISNPGGFRDTIKAGSITKSDILSIFPFENFIVEAAEVGGDDLLYDISLSENAYCIRKGVRIGRGKKYKVVTSDFIYQGGDGYRFTNSQGMMTDMSWRTPLEKFMLKTSSEGLSLEEGYKKLTEKYEKPRDQ